MTTTRLYRYRVVEAWGSFADAIGKADHLLEAVDYGPERQWNVFDDTAGKTTGGGVGEFVDVVELCGCGHALAGVAHDRTDACQR